MEAQGRDVLIVDAQGQTLFTRAGHHRHHPLHQRPCQSKAAMFARGEQLNDEWTIGNVLPWRTTDEFHGRHCLAAPCYGDE